MCRALMCTCAVLHCLRSVNAVRARCDLLHRIVPAAAPQREMGSRFAAELDRQNRLGSRYIGGSTDNEHMGSDETAIPVAQTMTEQAAAAQVRAFERHWVIPDWHEKILPVLWH